MLTFDGLCSMVYVRVRAEGDNTLCFVSGCTYTSWNGEIFLGEISGRALGSGDNSKLF